MTILSLIVPYRGRPHHLLTLVQWFSAFAAREVQLIVVEGSASASAPDIIGTDKRIEYIFFESAGPFHLTRALNLGLSASSSHLLAKLDVDLIPTPNSLERHLAAAVQHPSVLWSGYRLMSQKERVPVPVTQEDIAAAAIAEEDLPCSLSGRLKHRERFGVVAMFDRERLLSLGGWDERYVGWGAEDQDLLERYTGTETVLARCEDFLYLHQHHERDHNWREAIYTERNRTMYARERLIFE